MSAEQRGWWWDERLLGRRLRSHSTHSNSAPRPSRASRQLP